MEYISVDWIEFKLMQLVITYLLCCCRMKIINYVGRQLKSGEKVTTTRWRHGGGGGGGRRRNKETAVRTKRKKQDREKCLWLFLLPMICISCSNAWIYLAAIFLLLLLFHLLLYLLLLFLHLFKLISNLMAEKCFIRYINWKIQQRRSGGGIRKRRQGNVEECEKSVAILKMADVLNDIPGCLHRHCHQLSTISYHLSWFIIHYLS